MSRGRSVPHFQYVDLANIRSCFVDNRTHRACLEIPFCGDRGSKTLCIIGQNPSAADEREADKTIHYLEKLVYQTHPEYRQLIILNLYSRVDTDKSERASLLHPQCERIFNQVLGEENDVLVVFGKLSNKGRYRLLDRARQIEPLLRAKRVFKLDIGTPYAPHPGNARILYNKFDVGFTAYDFADILTQRVNT